MTNVLIANGLWLAFLSFWCVIYYVQERADRAGGGSRYAPYVPPAD